MMDFLNANLPGSGIWNLVIGISRVYELLIILSIVVVIGLVLGLKTPMKIKALISLASLLGYIFVRHAIDFIAYV
tara:strand:+ start:621 stop:845 length:225 start_codon:yes stop_codon:yes gene_type:complete